jgi:chromosome segregation ATPase
MAQRQEDGVLAYARELERTDERLARAIGGTEELQEETSSLRARAVEVDVFLRRLPVESEAAETAVRGAEQELVRRLEELREAEGELERARQAGEEEGEEEGEEVAAARRAIVRTRDAAAMSERKLERAREARERLEREAERARRDAPELGRRARELAARLADVPGIARHAPKPPEPGLTGVIAWAARAQAALFVVRGGLESERGRVVRQANELGASALGEPLSATSVALVRERLERR